MSELIEKETEERLSISSDSSDTTNESTSTSITVSSQPSEETIAQANKLKDEGNAYLSAGRFAVAAEKYTQAIELYPTAIFYSNRAQALIKLESYGLAIADANEALK